MLQFARIRNKIKYQIRGQFTYNLFSFFVIHIQIAAPIQIVIDSLSAKYKIDIIDK